MLKKFFLLGSVLSVAVAVNAQVVAVDTYELPNSNPPNGSQSDIGYGYNGGIGFGALSYVSGSPGTVSAANGTDGGRQLDGFQSLQITSGGGTQVAGRTVNTPVTTGVFNLDARWDLNNGSGLDPFTGINIDTALGSTLGAGELLSFGLIGGNNSQFLITDGSGPHLLNVGTDNELRGGIFNFNVAFDTGGDSYILTVTDKSNGQMGTISGALEGASPGAVAAFKIGNLDSESGTELIVDNTVFTAVPEPSTIAAGVLAVIGTLFIRRRRCAA